MVVCACAVTKLLAIDIAPATTWAAPANAEQTPTVPPVQRDPGPGVTVAVWQNPLLEGVEEDTAVVAPAAEVAASEDVSPTAVAAPEVSPAPVEAPAAEVAASEDVSPTAVAAPEVAESRREVSATSVVAISVVAAGSTTVSAFITATSTHRTTAMRIILFIGKSFFLVFWCWFWVWGEGCGRTRSINSKAATRKV